MSMGRMVALCWIAGCVSVLILSANGDELRMQTGLIGPFNSLMVSCVLLSGGKVHTSNNAHEA